MKKLLLILFVALSIAAKAQNHAASVTEFTLPLIVTSEEQQISCTINNTGKSVITSLELCYQVDNEEEIVYEVIPRLYIEFKKSQTFTFSEPMRLRAPGNHTAYVWISKVNGHLQENPVKVPATFDIPDQIVPRKVMMEEFTAASCGPCQAFNENHLDPLLALPENQEKYVVVKYQMNFPFPGDPYYINESGTRRNYYEVNSIPQLFMDGVGYKQTVNQTLFDQRYNIPGCVDMTGTFSLNGSIITIDAEIMPYISYDNCAVFVAVNEKMTYENALTHEQEFHHVIMKLFPNGNGSKHNLISGEKITLHYTEDLSTTNIEEFTDLEVAIYVQHTPSKMMLNAEWVLQDADLVATPLNLQTEVNDNDVTLTWSSPEKADLAYNIYRDNALIASNVDVTSYTDSNVYNGTYTYSVRCVSESFASLRAFSTIAVQTPIAVPENIQVSNENLHASLTWNPVNDATGYNIYRNGTKINKEPITDNAFNETLNLFGTYCYKITTLTGYGESAKSECAMLTIENNLPIPSNIQLSGMADITVEWDAVFIDDLKGYNIYRDGEKINETFVTQTSFFNHVADPSNLYCYTVTAVVGYEESRAPEAVCIQNGVVIVGIDEADNETFSVYPNPTSGQLRITNHESEITNIRVFDITGRLLKAIHNINNTEANIDLSDCTNGVYLLNVDGKTMKIVKQ